jgi:transglutaminase superfamily protein
MARGSLTQMTADEPSKSAVERYLEVTALIPRESRDFSIPATCVPGLFGIPAGLITRMLRLGLPSEPVNGIPHFERSDLVNMSLYLRAGRRYLTIRKFWPRALRALDGKRHIGYRLSYTAKCPFPEYHANCRFRMLTPAGPAERQGFAGNPEPVYTTDIWLPAEWPGLPGTAREVVDVAEKFEHAWLPRAIQGDLGFMRRTGLANCMGMSRILAAEGRDRGLEARSVFGLLIPPPYGGVHFWTEIKVEGVWVPADPLMIKQMMSWDVLDGPKWSPYRSLGGIQCRLVERGSGPETAARVVTHEREGVAASFPVCHLPAGSRQAKGGTRAGAK